MESRTFWVRVGLVDEPEIDVSGVIIIIILTYMKCKRNTGKYVSYS